MKPGESSWPSQNSIDALLWDLKLIPVGAWSTKGHGTVKNVLF